jgi:hypothetical protein
VSRRPIPSEFGFATGPFVPPAKPRSAWRTLLFSALLMLIPVVGPGISTVYVDRREDPASFDFMRALLTAVIQLVAVAVVAIVIWFIAVTVLDMSIQVSRG